MRNEEECGTCGDEKRWQPLTADAESVLVQGIGTSWAMPQSSLLYFIVNSYTHAYVRDKGTEV